MLQITHTSSSSVKSVGHIKETNTLVIEYRPGTVYRYDIPESKDVVELYHDVITAASIGRFVNTYVAYRYPYKLLPSDSAETLMALTEPKEKVKITIPDETPDE